MLRLPFGILKKGWVPISFLLLFTFVSNVLFQHGKILFQAGPFIITDEGLNTASVRTMRFFFMIAGAKLLTATTTPGSLVTALGRLLGPLRKLNIPIDDFLQIMGLAMKSLPRLKEEIALGCREKVSQGHAIGLFDRLKVISSQLMPVFVRSMQVPERHFEEEIRDRKDSQQCKAPAINRKDEMKERL
jgi:energy-coupling factor transport system permease protein